MLHFFYYGMEGLGETQRTAMRGFWDQFYFLASEPLPKPQFARHWGIDDWCPASLCDAVFALHEKMQYDVVMVNYVWMSRVLEHLDAPLRIIDTHDVFGDRHLVSVREGMEPRWFFTSLAEEERGFRRANLLIGIQDEETRSIQSRVTTQAITVGHLISPVFLHEYEDSRPIATFGYIASGNPWNVKCIVELGSALESRPECDWALAGSITRQRIRLKSEPYLLGIVAELRDFYEVVDCVVNPMMGGTGLKIKTVEALSFGKPIIGTRDAFVGLPIRHEAHMLLDAEQCAEAMCAYKVNADYRSAIRLASRELCFDYMLKVHDEFEALCKILSGKG